MKRYKTLITARLTDKATQLISPHCDITYGGWVSTGFIATTEEIMPKLEGVEVFVNGYEALTAQMLEKLPDLKFVAAARGNPVNVDVAACAKRGIPVVYTPGRNASGVAEFTLGLMLSLVRNISATHHALKSGRYLAPPSDTPLHCQSGDVIWDTPGENLHSTYGGPEISGRTLGLVGLGAIGKLVAAKAMALGMSVIAHDPYCATPPQGITLVGFEELLEQADIVSLHCKSTEQTNGMMNKAAFERMKPTAYFINTSRALLVEQSDFLQAMQNKEIAGAAIDVFWQEPLPQNHPILALENVLITPHIGGASSDVTAIQSAMLAEDVLCWIKGEPLNRPAKP